MLRAEENAKKTYLLDAVGLEYKKREYAAIDYRQLVEILETRMKHFKRKQQQGRPAAPNPFGTLFVNQTLPNPPAAPAQPQAQPPQQRPPPSAPIQRLQAQGPPLPPTVTFQQTGQEVIQWPPQHLQPQGIPTHLVFKCVDIRGGRPPAQGPRAPAQRGPPTGLRNRDARQGGNGDQRPFRPRKPGFNPANNKDRCNRCGEKGHWARECKQFRPQDNLIHGQSREQRPQSAPRGPPQQRPPNNPRHLHALQREIIHEEDEYTYMQYEEPEPMDMGHNYALQALNEQ